MEEVFVFRGSEGETEGEVSCSWQWLCGCAYSTCGLDPDTSYSKVRTLGPIGNPTRICSRILRVHLDQMVVLVSFSYTPSL